MQPFETFFYFVSVEHRQQYENDRNSEKEKETIVLMVTDIIAAECQQYRPHEPSYGADDEKFFCGKMSQPEDVAEIILGEPWDEKEQKNKKGAFVMEEVIVPAHRLFSDKFLSEGPPEESR